jgi:hypothetical protein
LDSRRLAPGTVSLLGSFPASAGDSDGPQALTASQRVIAAELQARGGSCDALSMMVSSVARMVQAGRCSENRWNAG